MANAFKMLKSDLGKKAAEFGGEISKQAQIAAENISKQTQELSQTATFKKVTEVNKTNWSHQDFFFILNNWILIFKNVKVIKQNLDEATQLSGVKPYLRPDKLRKRSEVDENLKTKVYESNE